MGDARSEDIINLEARQEHNKVKVAKNVNFYSFLLVFKNLLS